MQGKRSRDYILRRFSTTEGIMLDIAKCAHQVRETLILEVQEGFISQSGASAFQY